VDTRIVAISADSGSTSRALAARLKIPFPLLSDPQLRTIRAYGVREGGHENAVPAVFVVRRDGKVAWRKIAARPSVDEILRQAKRVRSIY